MNAVGALLGLLAGLRGCATANWGTPARPCSVASALNPSYSKAARLQQILQKYTALGVPGAVVALHSPAEGYWVGAAGYAHLEDHTPMQVCHLQYGQSVAKTYLAVAVLTLYEAGRLSLDAPITAYLPPATSTQLPDAGKITVRMLLNHTSGLPEYTANPTYLSQLLQHPEHSFSTADYLAFIARQPLDFPPGSRYDYRNTNYLVLALVADHVYGSHSQLIQNRILTPLGLQQTFYHSSPPTCKPPTWPIPTWSAVAMPGWKTYRGCSR